MDHTERRNATARNVDSFVKESQWKDWFQQPSFNGKNFFSFLDYTNKNYETLMAYCNARGWTIPLFGELDNAMRGYLLAHSHFYLQHTYPSTQRDAYRAVRPFVSIEPEVVPVDERQAAMDSMKGLNAKQLKENMQQIRNSNLTNAELRRRGQLLR